MTTQQLGAQADAGRAATTASQAINAERHLSVRTAVRVIVAGYPTSMAWDIVARSVERQARLAGLGRIDLGRSSLLGGTS